MVNLYGLKKFDLNLLIIFECIYQNLSISKAAEMLFITPSAISQSLQRLRNQLNDPLFVRSGKGIIPTKTGVNLHSQLEKCLNQLEQVININNRTELKKRVIIYSPPLLIPLESLPLIHPLYQMPNVQIEHHDLPLSAGVVENLLTYHKADLILSLSPLIMPHVLCHPLHEVKMVLVCRKLHPRAEQLTSVEAIAGEAFTYYLTTEPGIKSFQLQIKKLFPKRTIIFRSDSFATILNMINQLDVISVIPEVMLQQPFLQQTLKLLPIPMPSMMLYLICHATKMNNPLFAPLIEKIIHHKK